MKLLKVGGDDYAALDFEQQYDIEKVYQEMVNNKLKFIDMENEKCGLIKVSIHEFKTVDPDFIQFIQDNFLDYDDCKHTNFYVVEN